MKTTILALALTTVFTATSAFGQGAAVIIKQRAKEAAGRPVAAPAPAAQPAATGAPAPQTGAAQPNVSKILADLAVIKSRPQATQEQKDKLATNLGGVALGANKPSTEAVQALANALADAIAGKKISSADQATLAQSLAVALNADAGSPQFGNAIQNIKDALTLSGVGEAAIQTVAKALGELTTKAK
jgi:hypothetical protein